MVRVTDSEHDQRAYVSGSVQACIRDFLRGLSDGDLGIVELRSVNVERDIAHLRNTIVIWFQLGPRDDVRHIHCRHVIPNDMVDELIGFVYSTYWSVLEDERFERPIDNQIRVLEELMNAYHRTNAFIPAAMVQRLHELHRRRMEHRGRERHAMADVRERHDQQETDRRANGRRPSDYVFPFPSIDGGRYSKEVTDRATATLRRLLTDEQRGDFDKDKSFFAVGNASGRTYHITHGRQQNVFVCYGTRMDILKGRTGYERGLCFLTEGGLCSEDVMLAQKLVIECNEAEAMKKGRPFTAPRTRYGVSVRAGSAVTLYNM